MHSASVISINEYVIILIHQPLFFFVLQSLQLKKCGLASTGIIMRVGGERELLEIQDLGPHLHPPQPEPDTLVIHQPTDNWATLLYVTPGQILFIFFKTD